MKKIDIFNGPGGVKALLPIAVPVMISQFAQTAMLFTDRIFLARLGKSHAAAAISSSISAFLCISLFVGLISYGNALISQYYGAKQKKNCSIVAGQGFIIALASYPIVVLMGYLLNYLFIAMGHTGELLQLENSYVRLIVWGFIFSLLRTSLDSFFSGIGKTYIITIASIIGVLVNVPVNYVLIFGKFGFPKMGMRGAALGTIIGAFTIFIILLAIFLKKKYRREFQTHKSLKFNPAIFKKIFRFGTPSAAELFLNIFAFNMFIILFQSYGINEAVSVAIVFNWDMVSFIPLIGLQIGTSILFGQHLGAKNLKEAKRTLHSGLFLALLWSGLMTYIFLNHTDFLVNIFIPKGFAGDYNEVIKLSKIMLKLASIYLIFDAILIIFSGALRGAGDTLWLMITMISTHWIMVSLLYILIRVYRTSTLTAWYTLIGFVITLATMMLLRYKTGKWEKIKLIEH